MSNDVHEQYSNLYGELAKGDYALGQYLKGINGEKGELIWMYQSMKGLIYVLDDKCGWPYEVLAKDIVAL